MKLSKLLDKYSGEDIEINSIQTNSKEVKPGDLFLCTKGVNVDRHNFIDDAIKNGAVYLVTSKDVDTSIPYTKVEDTNSIIDELYSRFYRHPLNELTIIGVTGTDGKTSTTSIIQTLLGNDICGYIGTNGYSCSKFNRSTSNTTPAPEKLYQYFREFLDAGCRYVAMEASSEGFYYGRLKNINFEVGSLTNVFSEHLNTHGTLENYISCKKQLFSQSRSSVLNSNDLHFNEFLEISNNVSTYGYKETDTLYIKNYSITPNNTEIEYVYDNKTYSINSPLLGLFNIENLSCALLSCLKLGFTLDKLIKNIPLLKVDGRMSPVELGQDFYCIIDYAHTPNGLTRLFEFTNTLNVNRKIVVIGQAGERDPFKRKTVGKIVSDSNDIAIFTYEDPRSEDIMTIIDMMKEEVTRDNVLVIPDRHDAIVKAIEIAEKNDMVMILGKGNETYQKKKEGTIYFNDIEEAVSAIKNKLEK